MLLNKAQGKLLALAAVFVVPVAVAYMLVTGMSGSDTAFGTRNYGELISPVKPLQDVAMHTLQGRDFVLSDLRGKWVLVYIGPANCDEKCKQTLYKLRQGRLAQGGEYRRIERVYIVSAGEPGPELTALHEEDSGLGILLPKAGNGARLIGQFDVDATASRSGAFLVDPLGNLMMHYPDGFEAKGLAKDMALLLKASYVG